VDATGQVVETFGHDAFGQRTDASAAAQSHRFAGEYWDEDAQLVYLRARWYDPKLGRFISGDPFEGRQGDPRSLNRYGYGHGDPVHNTDPSGKESLMSLSTAFTAMNVAATSFLVTSDLMEGNYGAAATELAIGIVAGKVGSWVGSAGLTQFVTKNLGWLSRLTRTTKTITLYRAVGVAEYEQLIVGGKLAVGPSGFGGKQFALTLEEAIDFANQPLNREYVAVFKVVVDENVIKQLGHFSKTIDPFIFKNGVWTFAAEQMNALNQAVRSISHVF